VRAKQNPGSAKKASKIPRLVKQNEPGSGKKISKIPRLLRYDSKPIKKLDLQKDDDNDEVARELDLQSCDNNSEYAGSECPSNYTDNTSFSADTDTVSLSSHSTYNYYDIEAIHIQSSLGEESIARCLQKDLIRDNARLKLQMLHLQGEIEYFYEILSRIEAFTFQHDSDGNEGKQMKSDATPSVVKEFSTKVINIIGASMPSTASIDYDFDELKPEIPDDVTF